MTKHFHECVCGVEFPCLINILPVEGGRIRCERVYESVCPSCFDSMLQNASTADLESMAGVCDPLTAWRAREVVAGRLM